MKKKIIIIALIILVILLLAIGFTYAYRYVAVMSLDNKPQPYNLDIIEKIKTNQFDFPVMSWNTKKFGRIYASVGSPPTPMYACSNIMDAGVSFYDAMGKYLGNCNSLWSEGVKFPYDCSYLTDLTYANADYKSNLCAENEPEVKVDLKDNLKDYAGIFSKYAVIDNQVYFLYWMRRDCVVANLSDCSADRGIKKKLIPGANAEKFMALDETLAKDDKNLYYASYKPFVQTEGNEVKIYIIGADMDTLTKLSDIYGGQYFKDKNHIYLLADNSLKIIEGADPLTFVLLSNHYAKDKERIYFDGAVVKDADAGTFEIPNDENSYFKIKKYYKYFSNNYGFDNLARDKNFYYFKGEKLEGISSKANIYYYIKLGNIDRIILKEGDVSYSNIGGNSDQWNKAAGWGMSVGMMAEIKLISVQ